MSHVTLVQNSLQTAMEARTRKALVGGDVEQDQTAQAGDPRPDNFSANLVRNAVLRNLRSFSLNLPCDDLHRVGIRVDNHAEETEHHFFPSHLAVVDGSVGLGFDGLFTELSKCASTRSLVPLGTLMDVWYPSCQLKS